MAGGCTLLLSRQTISMTVKQRMGSFHLCGETPISLCPLTVCPIAGSCNQQCSDWVERHEACQSRSNWESGHTNKCSEDDWRGLYIGRGKLPNVDIRKKLHPESASDMVNSRQRKRTIKMNYMSVERGTKMFEGEMEKWTANLYSHLYLQHLKSRTDWRVVYVGVHVSEEGPYSLRKISRYIGVAGCECTPLRV